MENKDNLKPLRSESEAREKGRKGGIASGAARRRKKTLQQTIKMVAKLPMDEIGIKRAKRSGVNIDDIDPEDMTAMTGMVIGQVQAAALGSSQAARIVTEWMDLSEKHKKDQLEIERLRAEIDKLKAETERLRSGQTAEDDDMVLQFISGMQDGTRESDAAQDGNMPEEESGGFAVPEIVKARNITAKAVLESMKEGSE